MSKPSGKPRKHGRKVGGRPSNKERWEEQQAQIDRLRRLVSQKNHSTETWQMIDRLMAVIIELEDLSSPIRAATYDGTGHAAEHPILPGVRITEAGRIVHAGSYAAEMSKWLHRQIRWTVASAERRIIGAEPDPKPKMPRRETSQESQGPESRTVARGTG